MINFRMIAGGFLLAATAAIGAPTTPTSTAPDLSVGATQYPNADAIILRWEQDWNIASDGTVKRREHQWVKVLTNRAINRFADPRIEFNADADEVKIVTAQTHLPNGEVLTVPQYSVNIGAAHDVQGWPALASWRERIISFSGIEPGVTLELEYEVTSKTDPTDWQSADIRLDDDAPLLAHVVSVRVPANTALAWWSSVEHFAPKKRTEGGMEEISWQIGPFPAGVGVAQAPTWRDRSPRLVWSTAKSPAEWTQKLLAVEGKAVADDEALAAFAKKTCENEHEPAGQLRALADAWKKRFNLINSPKAIRGLNCRPAGAVFASGYGSTIEATAALHAALKSLGLSATPYVAVDDRIWQPEAAVDAAFSGIVLEAATPDGPVWVTPEAGYFDRVDGWGGHLLLSVNESGKLQTKNLPRRGADGNTFNVTGRVKIGKDGKPSGELRFRVTGLFFAPESLRTSDDQKKFVDSLLGRAVKNLSVASYTVQTLSPTEFAATAKLAEDKSLPAAAKGFMLTLADAPMSRADVPLPLERSYRDLPVELTGPFREVLALDVEFAEGASAAVLPVAAPERNGAWGKAGLTATIEERVIHLERRIEVAQRLLPAADFAALREALLDLSAPASTTLVIVP